MHHTLCHNEDILDIDKGHFKVYLRKFGLSVGAQVFVAEASCELDISVVARDHKQLLVDLRRLRQGVEFARVNS